MICRFDRKVKVVWKNENSHRSIGQEIFLINYKLLAINASLRRKKYRFAKEEILYKMAVGSTTLRRNFSLNQY